MTDTERNRDYAAQNKLEETQFAECSVCKREISPEHRIIFKNDNIWGVPVGVDLCAICLSHRKYDLKKKKLYTGLAISPVPNSEIVVPILPIFV